MWQKSDSLRRWAEGRRSEMLDVPLDAAGSGCLSGLCNGDNMLTAGSKPEQELYLLPLDFFALG